MNNKLRELLSKIPIEKLEEVYLERKNDTIVENEKIEDEIVLNLKRYITLVIPDLQIPAHHQDSFEFLQDVYMKHNCNLVINQGDEVDQHTISFHSKDPDTFSASQEAKLSKVFLQRLYKIFPKMYICHSNHGSLVYRQAKANGLSKDQVRSLKEIYGIGNGWKWANKIIIKQADRPDIMFIHNLSGNALNNAKSQGISVSQGHYHTKAELYFHMLSTGQQIFGITTGSLVDRFHPFLNYARNSKELPRLGCWVIDNGSPKYVPMLLDKNGRWVGRKKRK